MTTSEIRLRRDARPFIQFSLTLRGGKIVQIRRPDCISFNPHPASETFVIWSDTDGLMITDSSQISHLTVVTDAQ